MVIREAIVVMVIEVIFLKIKYIMIEQAQQLEADITLTVEERIIGNPDMRDALLLIKAVIILMGSDQNR